MDEYIGIIKLFAGIYAPQDYMFCRGQQLEISDFASLYSILGTNFGGDGINYFNLPDLRGRVPIGVGQLPLPNHSEYTVGLTGGAETVTLKTSQMPTHTHGKAMNITGGTGSITGVATATMRVNSADGSVQTPANSYLGLDNSLSGNYSATTNDATLSPGAIMVNSSGLKVNVSNLKGNIIIGETGGSQPHLNIQPFLAINWIICTNGIYPPRN